jgi:hypothetical protein
VIYQHLKLKSQRDVKAKVYQNESYGLKCGINRVKREERITGRSHQGPGAEIVPLRKPANPCGDKW